MKINKKVFYLSLILTLLCNPVSYATEGTSLNIGKAILKFIFYIFIILVVIIITIYGTRFIAKNSKRFINSKYIKILDRIGIDTNTKIIVLEINNYIYILGITNNYMETIDKIPKEDFNLGRDSNFENQLEWQKNKYIKSKDSSKFKISIEQFSDTLNKFFNKEDENDEK